MIGREDDVVIRIRGLRRVYGRGDAEVRALDGVDLDIPRGIFLTLMGPSGSGKSTLLNAIGLLDVPTAGSLAIEGREMVGLSRRERALARRERLGFVFQGFNLLMRSTALQNVELPLVYRGVGRAERRRRSLEALAAVGLADRADHLPNELSGGQQQRVAIARAIVGEPEILLADEPTGNLDTVMSHEVMQLLRRLNSERGITVVMVSHEPEMTVYTDRIAHFRDGRLENIETVKEAA
ncbi:MAG: ABC transporter ATP-binding protein [Alphaproteobacteria bacterium]|nr:ABC transporter ATP-binding protein [Alphaproteobacteria bacterium]